jgi:hypothetical protein
MIVTYMGLAGPLTVDELRILLGYHEYYAHGIKLLAHPMDNTEINRIEESYFFH